MAKKKKEEVPAAEAVAAFAADAKKSRIAYLGIDPGSTGAIALVTRFGGKSIVFDIPAHKTVVRRRRALDVSPAQAALLGRKSKAVNASVTEFDYAAICEMFEPLRSDGLTVVAAVEKIPPKVGPGPLRLADVRIYGSWAMWPLFLTSCGFTLEEPTPSVWKASFALASKEKEETRSVARTLFPACEGLDRKMDHNRAEALLIAEYGRRKYERPIEDAPARGGREA